MQSRINASPWAVYHGVRLFNALGLTLAAAVCTVIVVAVKINMAGTDEAEWWPLVALVYSAIAGPLVLLIGGLIRNFAMFRS